MQLVPGVSLDKTGQLDTLVVDTPQAMARICLFGAHVTSFIPKADNRERLWMSSATKTDGSNPLRGGIPVCWPWFGSDHGQSRSDLPAHGFVRNQHWQLHRCEQRQNATVLELFPQHTRGTGFDADTALSLTVEVSDRLTLRLTTCNQSDHDIRIGGALHSYFAVGDVHQAEIHGLSGPYRDKTRDMAIFETPVPYSISGETDRVHLCQPESVSLVLSEGKTLIGSAGHDSIVVWNPWQQKSVSMPDMPDDGYRHMLCIETALVGGITLAAGQQHVLTQWIG